MQLTLLGIGAATPDPGTDWAAVYVANTLAEVDLALDQVAETRLVIDADLAGLSLVLNRLLRRGLLATMDTAVLTREPVSYLAALGLASDRAGQLAIASTGTSRLVGVVKDDSGGLCVNAATVSPWEAAGTFWVRAVVDDQRLCDGSVRSVSFTRLGPSSLEATVQLGRFRSKTLRGRSLQLACDDAQIVADGVGRERPRSKRTFWSEPELWRLAL